MLTSQRFKRPQSMSYFSPYLHFLPSANRTAALLNHSPSGPLLTLVHEQWTARHDRYSHGSKWGSQQRAGGQDSAGMENESHDARMDNRAGERFNGDWSRSKFPLCKTIHKPPSAPITKASTISPLSITRSLVGKQRSPFARLRLVTFELRCPPVLTACSSPSLPAVNTTL